MYDVQTTEKTFRGIFPNRRKKPTPVISRYSFIGGRRRAIRRKEDLKRDYFVDIYSAKLLVIILSLLILSLFDSCLTVILIKENLAIETNPIMASLLNFGNLSFLAGKFMITAVSVIILCICKNFPFIRFFLASAVIIYMAIVAYELSIIMTHLM